MTSSLLLDTCALIWMAGRQPLAEEALTELNEAFVAGRPLMVSMITAWELGLLSSKGRLPAAVKPQALFDRFLSRPGVEIENLSPEILIESSFLPATPPNDPADRIIVATARAQGLTIVTRDRPILDYAKQGYVRALPC